MYKPFFIIIHFLILTCCILSCNGDGGNTATKATAPAVVKETKKPTPSKDKRKVMVTGKSTTVKAGEVVCVDVVVYNFKDVLSMQYGMNWDKDVLEYQSVKSFGLPSLGENNFGNTNAAIGKLAISWFDNNLKSISVEDGKIIYQVCFKAIGKSGSQSKFLLSSDPIVIEFSGKGDQMLNLDTQMAYVKIQ